MVAVPRGNHLAYVGIFGTGYGRAVVKQIMPALKSMAADRNPFGGNIVPKKTEKIHWLKPKLVAEIEFAGFIGDGMVHQAALKGLQNEKIAEDVRPDEHDKTWRAKASVKSSTTKKTYSNSSSGVMGGSISKPDKLMWPHGGDGEPVTKLDPLRPRWHWWTIVFFNATEWPVKQTYLGW